MRCPRCGGSGEVLLREIGIVAGCSLCDGTGEIKTERVILEEKVIEKLKKLRHRLREGRLIEALPDGVSLRQSPSETDLDLAEVIDVLIELLEARER